MEVVYLNREQDPEVGEFVSVYELGGRYRVKVGQYHSKFNETVVEHSFDDEASAMVHAEESAKGRKLTKVYSRLTAS